MSNREFKFPSQRENRIYRRIYTVLFLVTVMTCVYMNGQTSMRKHMVAQERQLQLAEADFVTAVEIMNRDFKPHAKPSRWDAVNN